MGVAGCDALVARARSRVARSHPAITELCREPSGDVQVDDVLAAISAHGEEAVIAAIEALLAALIEVLSRLIGEDMATRLIDQDGPQSRRDGGRGAP
jgi:hypothetical protein